MLTQAKYSELRRTKVLVTYDPRAAVIHALLRVDPRESFDTREKVERLGFVPAQASPTTAVSWTRKVGEREVGALCERLSTELRGAGVYDLGSVFPAETKRPPVQRERLPAFWTGPFVAFVKSTSRAVVFDRSASEDAIRDAFEAQEKDYYAAELTVPTE